jgi:hypothetical protein
MGSIEPAVTFGVTHFYLLIFIFFVRQPMRVSYSPWGGIAHFCTAV